MKKYNIVGGPSRDAILNAFKYAFDETYVSFAVVAKQKNVPIRDVMVLGLDYEDGSGEKFNLRGHCRARLDSGYQSYEFEAYYSARSHKGFITLYD